MAEVEWSEEALIERLFAPIAGPGALGLRDDAALLKPTPGCELVLTTDAVLAGVHFFKDDPPETIARRALRVNLSDLAAKAAAPRGFLLTLALPKAGAGRRSHAWLEAFAKALGEDAAAYGCPLLGGDTDATPGPLSVTIAAFGEVPEGRMVRRTGVRPGDLLYVTGTIGDGALGLKAALGETPGLKAAERAFLIDRYRLPQPRLALRDALLAHASGGMDVSDGLVGDLSKMLKASGLTATVDLRLTPLSPAARAALALDSGLFDAAVTGGDDYELLVSVPPDRSAAFAADAAAAGVPVTQIGAAEVGAGPPRFLGADGALRTFARGSYSHF